MKKLFALTFVVVSASLASLPAQQAPQIFTGRISDSTCGASHQGKTAGGDLTDRECVAECIKALAKYVLVDQNNKVTLIANQDLPGLPFYAGRLVRLTAEMKGDGLAVSKIEAIPPHLHIGHVMMNWRDTPGNVGFLTAAIVDARTAGIHAKLAATAPDNLDQMKLHAGHVLHALDPSIETKGPG